MKQYCRYCAHLCTGNGIWCDERQREMAESTTKTVNHCKDFAFCEIDAYDPDHTYTERKLVQRICDGQMKLFD